MNPRDPSSSPAAALLEAVRQAVIVTDLGGSITYWNSIAEDLYGWKAEEVIGKQIVDVTPALSRAEHAEEIMETLRAGKSWGGPFTVRHRNGREFEALVIIAPLLQKGTLSGIIGISIPVTEQPAFGDAADPLTPREREIGRMTAEGTTSAAVARALGIRIRTVESHRSNLYQKLGIHSRTELIVFAIRNGYLRLENG
jgi:PAS domain S-box-containing protein